MKGTVQQSLQLVFVYWIKYSSFCYDYDYMYVYIYIIIYYNIYILIGEEMDANIMMRQYPAEDPAKAYD